MLYRYRTTFLIKVNYNSDLINRNCGAYKIYANSAVNAVKAKFIPVVWS